MAAVLIGYTAIGAPIYYGVLADRIGLGLNLRVGTEFRMECGSIHTFTGTQWFYSGQCSVAHDPFPAGEDGSYIVGASPANDPTITPWVDVGVLRDRVITLCIALKTGVKSDGERLLLQWSRDGVSAVSPCPNAAGNDGLARNDVANGVMCIQGRPMGRYVRIRYVNGSVPQTELELYLAVLSGV